MHWSCNHLQLDMLLVAMFCADPHAQGINHPQTKMACILFGRLFIGEFDNTAGLCVQDGQQACVEGATLRHHSKV